MPVENYLRPAQKCKTKTSWCNQDAAPSAGSAPGGREDAPLQPSRLLQNLPGQQDDEGRACWPEVLSQTFLTRLPESALSLGQLAFPRQAFPGLVLRVKLPGLKSHLHLLLLLPCNLRQTVSLEAKKKVFILTKSNWSTFTFMNYAFWVMSKKPCLKTHV